MKLLIKIPTRERGFDWLQHYLKHIVYGREAKNTQIWLTLDSDEDPQERWDNAFKSGAVGVRLIIGESNSKIDAYNRDIGRITKEFDWDVLLVGSDDMWPRVDWYNEIILEDMQKYFPDTDGCLWYDTEDLHKARHINAPKGSPQFLQKGICMLPVMGRKYYERFGYVYHPAYKAFWCDNEYTRVAQRLGKIQYIENRIIEHQHPSWGGGMPDDDLYQRNNKLFREDMKTFNARQRNGFK